MSTPLTSEQMWEQFGIIPDDIPENTQPSLFSVDDSGDDSQFDQEMIDRKQMDGEAIENDLLNADTGDYFDGEDEQEIEEQLEREFYETKVESSETKDAPISLADIPPGQLYQSKMFQAEALVPSKGKTVEALAYSRNARDELVRLFRGLVPQSVMLADKATRDANDLATGTYEASGQLAQKRARGEAVENISKSFEVSGRGGASGALSKFPQNIGRSMLLLYTNEIDLVVDPFAGHNSRMELCVRARRSYWGQDLSHNFVEFNRGLATDLRATYPEIDIKIAEGSSVTLQYPDECGDFTITSPPYWDIEYYGDELEQMGNCATYSEFINVINKVTQENFRVLKPGAFCVWYINDFRKNGKFYPYHVDTMNSLIAAGFTMWDITITDFGRTFRSAFVNQIVEQKILPKRHEYGIVVRKPGWQTKPVRAKKESKPKKQKAPKETQTQEDLLNGIAIVASIETPQRRTANVSEQMADLFKRENKSDETN